MTPQEKCDLVKANIDDLFKRMQKEALVLLNQKGNFDKRITRAYQIIDALAAEVGKVALCKQGCSHCCYQSVLIPLWEARRIAKFSGRKINHIAGFGHDNDTPEQLRDRHCGTSCPFLTNGNCMVYPVRPFVCRLHLSVDNDVFVCDIQGNPGAPVAYYDFEGWKKLMTMMFLQKSTIFGDIREFFEEKIKC